MRAVQKRLGMVMLLASCANAQNRIGVVHDVATEKQGSGVRIEVTLSLPAKASVRTVSHPDRIVLELVSAKCETKPGSVNINFNGVQKVRTAQYSDNPPVVRIVVDLDQPHQYTMRQEKTRIVLDIHATVKLRTGSSQGAPGAGASGKVTGIFRRHGNPQAQDDSDLTATVEEPSRMQTSPAVSNSVSRPATVDSSASPQFTSTPQPPPAIASSPPHVEQPAFDPAQVVQSSSHATDDGSSGTSRQTVSTPVAATSESTQAILTVRAADPSLRTVFKVKYVAEGVAYLDGGRTSGLTDGMKLEVQESDHVPREGVAVEPEDAGVVAELVVTAVAETSAVTDIHAPKRSVKPGDLAYLSSGDSEALVQQRALSATRKYPAVITFTEGDPLDEEVRDEIPRPPMPSVNRARGRIGVDYLSTISHGTSAITSSDAGMIFRGDITRINGTYWNLSGYWRGRFTSQAPAGQQTLQDLINRTYHLSMTYDNPNSSLVAGFGRLYLPWAPSLNTIDGGYFGKRLAKGTTLGIFGGSTPDPTSWNYSPGRVISGAFINFDGGSFDGVHYSSTSGAGISMVNWQQDRPFVFFENTVSYKRYLSIYDSLQADNPSGNPAVPAPGPGLSVNFLTVRVQPHPRLELDFNYNYFRDIPTFDPTLIGTGLLDKYLFQGFSVGGRVEVWKQISVYTDVGRSNRTGDTTSSLNQMYGITFGRLPWLGLRADAHYARFNSSFGNGSYRAFSLSRNFLDGLRLEVLAGDQNFASAFTSTNQYRFITGNVESNLGSHYFVQGGYTANRGQLSYDQWMFTIGYRFDSKERRHE
ncbi:MAG TPA: AMIN domain-containing protein [Terriglobales bacterium]|nr:AMIN domain-containing protein [Terriglobales bacterium]